MESNTRHSVITPEEVSCMFIIGIYKAKDTFIVTIQKVIIHVVHPLGRRYIVDNMWLNRKRLNAQFYTDPLLAKTESLEGNTGAWIYTTGNFTVVYSCTNSSELGYNLQYFAGDIGIPYILRSYLVPEITGKHTEFQARLKRLRIYLTHSEVERSNNNHATGGDIGRLKKRFWQNMVSKKFPKNLWDYGLVHQDGILSCISRGKTVWTGIEKVTGKTPEISEWIDFEFYDRIWWLYNKHPLTTDDNIILGKWLGISHKIGSVICYWVLNVSGRFVAWNIL